MLTVTPTSPTRTGLALLSACALVAGGMLAVAGGAAADGSVARSPSADVPSSQATGPDFGQLRTLPPLRRQTARWRWLDGSAAGKDKTFDEASYGADISRIGIGVKITPRFPLHMVVLEYQEQGIWKVESSGSTSARNGQVVLRVSPYCQSGTWCRGTWPYRLRVLQPNSTATATRVNLKITFVPRDAPTPTPEPTTPTPEPTTPTPTPTPTSTPTPTPTPTPTSFTGSRSSSDGTSTITWEVTGVFAIPANRPDIADAGMFSGVVYPGTTVTISGTTTNVVPQGGCNYHSHIGVLDRNNPAKTQDDQNSTTSGGTVSWSYSVSTTVDNAGTGEERMYPLSLSGYTGYQCTGLAVNVNLLPLRFYHMP